MAGPDFSQFGTPAGKTQNRVDLSEFGSPAPSTKETTLGDTVTGFLGQITQGATLGFSDELIAGAEAAARAALFGEDFDTAFDATVERVRQAMLAR